jgi:hypothetical protein
VGGDARLPETTPPGLAGNRPALELERLRYPEEKSRITIAVGDRPVGQRNSDFGTGLDAEGQEQFQAAARR